MSEVDINGQIRKLSEENYSATFPFNMLSRCPVMTMPSGLVSNGVPTGIQSLGRTVDDQPVFGAALAYEQAFTKPTYRLDQRILSGD